MMKKLLILSWATLAASTALAEFVSSGTGKVYTFADLAQIETSGVTLQDGGYVVSQNFTIADGDTLRVMNGDVIKLGNKVEVEIKGYGDFQPADSANVTRASDGDNPKGFRFRGDRSGGVLKNMIFDYAGVAYGGATPLLCEGCTFRDYNGKLSSGSCLTMSASSDGNIVRNCYFSGANTAAISNGANVPVGILVEGNEFRGNGVSKRNYPQVNLACMDDYNTTIRNNIVVGIGENTLAGGIAVGNMLGAPFSGQVLIEGNTIEDNRYGIAMVGPMNLSIKNNTMLNNHYESNPNNGGSGISLYDSSNKGKVYIEGNHIENSLWGITIIGAPTVNAGKVENPNAEDYNPGRNVMVNNGNNGILYDLYNNGKGTVYAQGNKWNVEVQDSASIEQVVTHQADNPALGLVIFMPAYQEEPSHVSDVNACAEAVETRYFNLMGIETREPQAGINVVVTRYSDGTTKTEKVIR